jgi:sulfur carrier protein ThiS
MEVRLYSFLRLQAGSRALTLDLRQPTPLAEVLAQIVRLHPKLGPSLLGDGGGPAEHLVVTINGSQWRGERDAQPLIRDADVLDLFLAIGGG